MSENLNTIRPSLAPQQLKLPRTAMILAAGLGKRMLPITEHTPKPLVRVGGKPLIDYAMDSLIGAGVSKVVVNVHHLADHMEAHLSKERRAEIVLSDERDKLLDSGGGIAKALRHLGSDPFFVVNADSFWVEGFRPNLVNMAAQWNPERMDILLLVAGMANTVGYSGRGDFTMDPDGRLKRRGERHTAPFAYAGAGIFTPSLFERSEQPVFSLNSLFDRSLEQGRLFGVRLDGLWFHVGTPDSIREAEEAIARSAA